MSYNASSYVSKTVDQRGHVAYTEEENAVWEILFARQQETIQERACEEYLTGLKLLNLPKYRVPQCADVSAVLRDTTGWALEPVPALISFDYFFQLLASKRFPAATFIRKREELDYLKEPDIFHEIAGHCPLLTNPAYAEFVHTYGQLGLKANEKDRLMLARLFWFTVEFGLIATPSGLRVYGGGILSSINETVYALESEVPQRLPFEVMSALRTAYRIDVIQPIYFVLKSFDELYHLTELDLISLVHEANKLGKISHPLHPC